MPDGGLCSVNAMLKAWAILCTLTLAGGIAGCTSAAPDKTTATTAPQVTAATTPVPNSKEALETRAHQLDVLASKGDAASAYEFYSQRCKNIIGNLDRYKAFLSEWLKGRSPQYSGVTVKVNGSSGQVVSIDNDPNSPASSMQPRTWTFIDGEWQFDNC